MMHSNEISKFLGANSLFLLAILLGMPQGALADRTYNMYESISQYFDEGNLKLVEQLNEANLENSLQAPATPLLVRDRQKWILEVQVKGPICRTFSTIIDNLDIEFHAASNLQTKEMKMHRLEEVEEEAISLWNNLLEESADLKRNADSFVQQKIIDAYIGPLSELNTFAAKVKRTREDLWQAILKGL